MHAQPRQIIPMADQHTNLALIDAATAALKAACAVGDGPVRVEIIAGDGQRISLTARPAGEPAPVDPIVSDVFVVNGFQRGILAALAGKAMRTEALGRAVGDRRRLFRPGGLMELKAQGLVGWHRRLGYYSIDNPPPELSR